MITRELVELAYDAGVIRLVDYSEGFEGIDYHCVDFAVGELRNSFLSRAPINKTVDEFINKYSKDEIVNMLYETFEFFKEEFNEDYMDYDMYIYGNLPRKYKQMNLMHDTARKITELIDGLCKAKCEYRIMDDNYIGLLPIPQLSQDNHGHCLVAGDAYMIITCSNGYKYYINVTADSVLTACSEVFDFIKNKF